jgi:hypothetical protein
MNTYKKMLLEAKRNGNTSEKMMWESIDCVDALLAKMMSVSPEIDSEIWKFLREQHGIFFANHYNEEFARHDVSLLRYKDRDGEKRYGAHWTMDQVESAVRGLTFPTGTTPWDRYVAFNAMYSDLCNDLSDEEIIRAAYRFYFQDDDWGSHTKVWEYFLAKKLLHE